ncbi:TetR/AcrR family transcriptional regulator [Algoriphagus persicinus]|uniref:TetR/AcrR family transcriptional regulator n=1 Tax=Algoriphagus persicinus TaxID=3108754 RepID=UPI002B3D111E|nr:TetR/AcrR family transcriptional regulator [Algoriphagus sp. E1-3-M2]MEB2786856.1 TetR/AcrR family transcriptional regulator [Algoriphagus sp. E1-3-M2]
MRYKEFNRSRVLEKCIPLFWKNGFNACAISDIVKTTDVNRYSLYEEFGNKEGILHAALELYRERYAEKNLEILNHNRDAITLLRTFYLSFLKHDNPYQEGCFIIHIGTELADRDETVKAILRKYLADIRTLFTDMLQRDGESEEASNFFAKHLVGLFCTSMSFCLIHPDEERLDHINNGIKIILNKNIAYAKST